MEYTSNYNVGDTRELRALDEDNYEESEVVAVA
jgi:hypothetical protein